MSYIRLHLAYDVPSPSTAAPAVFKDSRDETSHYKLCLLDQYVSKHRLK